MSANNLKTMVHKRLNFFSVNIARGMDEEHEQWISANVSSSSLNAYLPSFVVFVVVAVVGVNAMTVTELTTFHNLKKVVARLNMDPKINDSKGFHISMLKSQSQKEVVLQLIQLQTPIIRMFFQRLKFMKFFLNKFNTSTKQTI